MLPSRSLVNQLEKRVLSFWFENCNDAEPIPSHLMGNWFGMKPEFDAKIRELFMEDVEKALKNDPSLTALNDTPQGSLSLILLLDQFPRNLFRNSAKMFSGDSLALNITKRMIENQWDLKLLPVHRMFVYLPLEHAEDLKMQDLALAKYTELAACPSLLEADKALFNSSLQYAERHRKVIAQFGRFPHRNALLGRSPTAEETIYTQNGGEDFTKPEKKN